MRTPERRFFASAAVLACVLTPAIVHAAPTPAPLTNNNYALEFFQGPLLAPVRVTGIGGAYTAIAEGSEGAASNAAAPAVRLPYSTGWFDYDIDLGLSFPGAYGGTDYDNRGQNADAETSARVNSFLHADVGGVLQFGELGVSVTTEYLKYTVASGPTAPTLSYLRGHALAAYGLLDNQLVVGAGARIVALSLDDSASSHSLLTMAGASPEAGLLWKPAKERYRLGFTARAPLSASAVSSDAQTDSSGVKRADGVILPTNVVLPWEIEAGVAVQIGARPLNPPWQNPQVDEAPLEARIADLRAIRGRVESYKLAATPLQDRPQLAADLATDERTKRAIEDAELEANSERMLAIRKARFTNWPRERLLLVASVLVAGESSNAVALEGLVNQNDQRVGQSIAVQPRLGVESEPIPNLVAARTGTYLEASRFADGHARQHFTFGGDVKLFYFSPFRLLGDQVWRLSGMIDLAPRYSNIGISIGAWH